MEERKELLTEIATLEDIALDGLKRYENSMLSNIPTDLADKGVLAVRMLMYFLDADMINEWTGQKTFTNVEESYILCGLYPDEHLKKVYETKEVEVDRFFRGMAITEMETQYKILDKKEDMRIRTEALRYWSDNSLDTFFQEMIQVKRGNIPFQDLLRYRIETDALKDDDVQNRKMAIDIHGLKNKNSKNMINVYVDGGGKMLSQGIIQSSNNSTYDLDISDDE